MIDIFRDVDVYELVDILGNLDDFLDKILRHNFNGEPKTDSLSDRIFKLFEKKNNEKREKFRCLEEIQLHSKITYDSSLVSKPFQDKIS